MQNHHNHIRNICDEDNEKFYFIYKIKLKVCNF